MTPSRSGLARLFPAALLLASLGLPLTACAQTEVVAEPEAVATEAEQATVVEATTEAVEDAADKASDDAKADAKPKPKKEKTAEELAAEKEQKEIKKLAREAQLRAAKLQAELAPLKEKKMRIEAELALLATKQQEAQSKAKMRKADADFKNQIELADMSRQLQQMQQQFQQMQVQAQLESLKRQAELTELSATNAKLAVETASVQAELALLGTQRAAASIDKDPMLYPAQPLNGKALTISDRRIPLNGAIGGGTANYVTERIHYFNNLDPKAPIFIVIDASPGGSVMEGYRIVTAMQNSEAPVHVVVKSYAASMAAVITTLAEESYTYPNALILHHQMSSGMRGNLTQQKEWLEEGMEWAKRLAVPVADKMGVTYDEFTELMYENNSDGDWGEFGDNAVKLKWVNHVVEDIRETALITAPVQANTMRFMQADETSAMPRAFTQYELFNSPIEMKTKIDGNGKAYTELPPLAPFDYYFMYDPDNRYRIAK